MASAPAYIDLGKPGSDLAARGFPAGATFKVNDERKIPAGVLVKSSASATNAGEVSFVVEPEYKWACHEVPVAFKGKWTSGAEVEGSLAFSDLVTKGTEVKPWFNKTAGGLGLKFANNQVNVSLKTESPFDLSQHKADLQVVVQFPDNLYWGVNAQFTQKTTPEKIVTTDPSAPEGQRPSPWLLQGRLHYDASASSAVTFAYEVDPKDKARVKLPQLGLTWYQKVNSDIAVSTGFVVPQGKLPSATIAADHRWSATNSLKTKVVLGAKNRVALAYTQTLTPNVTTTFGADLNANKLVGSASGDQSDHSFGFELKLK